MVGHRSRDYWALRLLLSKMLSNISGCDFGGIAWIFSIASQLTKETSFTLIVWLITSHVLFCLDPKLLWQMSSWNRCWNDHWWFVHSGLKLVVARFDPMYTAGLRSQQRWLGRILWIITRPPGHWRLLNRPTRSDFTSTWLPIILKTGNRLIDFTISIIGSSWTCWRYKLLNFKHIILGFGHGTGPWRGSAMNILQFPLLTLVLGLILSEYSRIDAIGVTFIHNVL